MAINNLVGKKRARRLFLTKKSKYSRHSLQRTYITPKPFEFSTQPPVYTSNGQKMLPRTIACRSNKTLNLIF
ncbi:MAG TPA: hypothetical protein DEB39_00540 [Planctomycetaceae bacterium]|nr:hypothetical protein [Planctomycetaceae bacterium]